MSQLEDELKKVENDIKQVDAEIEKLTERKSQLKKKREELKQRQNEEYSKKLASEDWETGEYSWTKLLHAKLKDVFNIEKFRPMQLSAINASLKGHDVILIMPTGGGKSLVYQLPSLLADGITLVISPLVSLMEDQLAALDRLGIKAAKLNANSTKEEVKEVFDAMTTKGSALKLLYVTPEKLAKSKRFMAKLQKTYQVDRLTRVAIDEVHCCSQWGHDFRPDYKFLGVLRSLFPKLPIIGLTATATSAVTTDVQKMLNLNKCLIFKASFNRANLYYEVRSKPSSANECLDDLVDMLQNRFRGQSGIIYTTTVKDCDQLASDMRKRKCKVAAYHANLEPSDRSRVHVGWRNNEYQAVIATLAFGMGIDKPDVRFVIHHSISKSMENFYQESGRAGRDDEKADCIVYWRLADLFRISTMAFTERTGLRNLYSMVAYCLDVNRCRREIIAGHFDERWESIHCNGMCDHCNQDSAPAAVDLNVTEHLVTMSRILDQAGKQDVRLTAQKLLDAWQNTGPTNLRLAGTKGKADNLPRDLCESILAFLLLEGYLKEDFHFTPYSTISYLVLGERTSSVDREIIMKVPASVAGASSSASGTGKAKTGRKSADSARPTVIKRRKIECLDISSDSE